MTLGFALAVALALTAGAYAAGGIAVLLGRWRVGSRGVMGWLALSLIAFAFDRTYTGSLPFAPIVTVAAAMGALLLLARTRIAGLRDALWTCFAAVPAIALAFLAGGYFFSREIASILSATAVAFFMLPGIAALAFYVVTRLLFNDNGEGDRPLRRLAGEVRGIQTKG